LQIDRINRKEDAGLLTEGKAYEQRLEVQRAMKDFLVKNLRAEQLILESLGKRNEALQVQREIEQAMAMDLDVRARERLKTYQGRLEGDFNNIIDGLINGTDSVTNVLRIGLRDLINTTLNTISETIIENLTGVKGGLGALLGNVLGKAIGKIIPFGSTGTTAAKDPAQAIADVIGKNSDVLTEAVNRQTDSLSTILNQQVQQSSQSLAQLTDLANCSCAPTPQEPLWKAILKGAISGAIGGAAGGLAGGFGGGERLGPSLAGNSNYTSTVGRHGVPLYQKRAGGGPVKKRSPYLVGELGMEMFVPDEDGFIIPHHKLTKAVSSLRAKAEVLPSLAKKKEALEDPYYRMMFGRIGKDTKSGKVYGFMDKLAPALSMAIGGMDGAGMGGGFGGFFGFGNSSKKDSDDPYWRLPVGRIGKETKLGKAYGFMQSLAPVFSMGMGGGGMGGFNGLGFAGGVIGGIKSLFGGKRAMGGPVKAGMSYLTGELGEEMYVPSAASFGASGGGSVAVNNNQKTVVVHQYNTFNIKSDNGQFTRASMQQIAAQSASAAQRALERSS
jgi:hypothetical protein